MTLTFSADCQHFAPEVGTIIEVEHPNAGVSGWYVVSERRFDVEHRFATIRLTPKAEYRHKDAD